MGEFPDPKAMGRGVVRPPPIAHIENGIKQFLYIQSGSMGSILQPISLVMSRKYIILGNKYEDPEHFMLQFTSSVKTKKKYPFL